MKITLTTLDNNELLLDLFKRYHFSKDLISKMKYRYNVYDIIPSNTNYEVILPNENTTVMASNEPINVVYEDEYLLVLNKPTNLSSIPSIRHYTDNLASRIKHYYDINNLKYGIHFVTRLDKLTNGLIIVAKHQYIQGLFKLKNIEIIKKYLTKVDKDYSYKSIIIEKPIKKIDDQIERIISEDGDYAKTKFHLIKKEKDYTLVEAILYTGKTHQIRLHLKSMGFPIIGDPIYSNIEGEFYLKCYENSFIHPITNKKISLKI